MNIFILPNHKTLILTYLFYLSIFLPINFAQTIDSISSDTVSYSSKEDTPQIKQKEEIKIGDITDGNKSIPVHLIKLVDEYGFTIQKDDKIQIPFSIKNTCGECHNYSKIKEGFHFSINRKDNKSKKGEPFIYTNHKILTLLPISYRGWEGTFNPDSLQISKMKFLDYFGTHFTGGNISENDSLESPSNYFRWNVSGKLEINCLSCHSADPEYDQSEFAVQIKNQNYRWAITAASPLGEVNGNASKMPDNFDPFNSNTFADVDLRTAPNPKVDYDFSKFNKSNKVFFNIKKEIQKERCLFCHTTTLNDENLKFLKESQDVHINSGLICVDCHKNDINHDMIRGYELEYLDKNLNDLEHYTCEGCHIKKTNSYSQGKLGAPTPKHLGIPIIHFERLSCTVCHSSYIIENKAKLIKTSRSHLLGVPRPNKTTRTFPLIQSPIFVKNKLGKLEIHNLIWPSFWGYKFKDKIKPYPLNFVETVIKPILDLDTLYNYGEWPEISDSLLKATLNQIKNQTEIIGNPIFVSGGLVFELVDSNITSYRDKSADAYTWPIGHNVRPASQSLGINGCSDCHSLNSDFFYSEIAIYSSVENTTIKTISANEFQRLNSFYQNLFSLSFFFRPILKIILIFSCLLIIGIFLAYFLPAIKNFSELFSDNQIDKNGL